MKVSIIVPVYNKEEYLQTCIDSLTKQTYEDIEIILVDDESTDKSGIICDDAAKEDSRIKVLHKKNSGAAGAWRAGFAECSGRYVCFVDSDDWIDTDMIERLVKMATDRDDEIVMSDYVIERSDGSKTYVYQSLPEGEYDRETIVNQVIPELWGHEDRRVCTSRCMKLISTKLIRDNEHYSREGLRFGEDNALSLPCVMDAGRIVVLDHAAMYHYRYVTGSVVHGYDKTLMDSIALLQSQTIRMIEDKFDGDSAQNYPEGYSDMLKERIWLEWPYLLIYAVKNEVRGNKEHYIDNIRKIACDPDNKKWIHDKRIKVNQTSNKLIYFVLKHPTSISCRLLRIAFNVWEHR